MARLLLIILGCALVTYVPRFLPLYILTRIKIPKVAAVWLRYVPVAVLAALIAPGIATAEGRFYLSFS
ncbi:MAG TPA: AzlD domain-containing protein, partial [Firmicutes bacterium]|nr:AzlD domain-containing protein [Bacillota bacterium]